MRKKAVCLILALYAVLSLTGCVKRTEITRRELEPNRIGSIDIVVTDITLNEAIACHIEYSRSISSLFLPQEGRFTTADGEEFEAKVLSCNYFLEGSVIQTVTISCHIQIFSLDGELITQQRVVCSNDNYDNANDQMKPYWDVIKITVNDLVESETEGD